MDRRIAERLMELQNLTDHLTAKRNELISHYENIVYLTNRIDELPKTSSISMIKFQKQKEILFNNLNEVKMTYQQKGEYWTSRCRDLINSTTVMLPEVLENVDTFRYEQQIAGNGAPVENNLEQVQSWCETLGGIWLNLRHELTLMATYFPPWEGDFNNMRRDVDNMVGQLVKRTFIVEKQPPQVLKTNTRFPSTVRSLIGGLLSSNTTIHHSPIVRASILNESQARMLMQSQDNTLVDLTSGAILNRESNLQWQPTTKQSIANFRTLILKKINRTEKKGTESVTDEKFALLFQAVIKLAAGELVFYVKTLSLPLVVIVHGNQENHAWATVTWDNAFASPDRTPFVVPDKVPWARVGQVLSTKFGAFVGCELATEDLNFLAGKAFRDWNLPECDQIYLSWAQFAKEPLPDRNFTFWEWFYSILKLTREHLKDLWRPDNRLIYGFIGRKQTEDALMDKPDGTFLLRYSETELGCITIAYKAENRTGDLKSVYMIKPFSQKDIQIRSLPDRINDLKHLKYLYPEIPKDQAFGKFYEPLRDVEPTAEGYIPPVLVTHIPEWAPGGGIDSYPSTPHSNINTQSPSMNEIYGDPPSSVGSLSSDVRLNVGPMTSFQDVDFFNIMDDVDYDMDDLPADLSGVGLNELLGNTNGFNCFGTTQEAKHE
ncbi:signal transducer and activator of transcription 5B isoform X1 [Tetranychus urticae]|uniref:Signal transducer and activator of transcription n=1 Tax=Tetranychus urticae TaxID=32264 RepID=T1L3P0_TETUR|nr:signal transducer and activator of transcription 5B isoform X1 [Tetranychus urticae]